MLSNIFCLWHVHVVKPIIISFRVFSFTKIMYYLGFIKIGGYNNLERLYFESLPSVRRNATSCGLPHADAFHVFLDPATGDQPWPGLVLQASLGCLWYVCCDQAWYSPTILKNILSLELENPIFNRA